MSSNSPKKFKTCVECYETVHPELVKESGWCIVCENSTLEQRVKAMMQRLSVNEKYVHSGIYIIFFDTGIKIGMTQELRHRINSYRQPWSQPISRILAYAGPLQSVNAMEQHLLAQFDFRKSEYIYKADIGNLDAKLLNTFTEFYPKLKRLKIDV